jgi:type III restriction enzyme
MILKHYQAQALDRYEEFLKRCKSTNSIETAYAQSIAGRIPTHLEYIPLDTFPHAPYVCLRIPTGGGKTLIAGMAIERINRSLLFAEHSVTLWLVPSTPILDQTLKALKNSAHLLHQSVFSALGEVTVMTVDEALHIKPHVLRGSNVIIVSTMQAFKQANIDRLSVYKQNTDMQSHLEGQADPAVIGNHSLVDVLRLHHPFLIVDEAHNQGTDLAFETLARLEPCAILELTATPDREHTPSNVLFSVGASVLQDENMIKMPLEVVRRDNWKDTLRDAISCLSSLQKNAEEEQLLTGEYLRPIMLLQAERSNSGHETLVPEVLKKAMIDDFGIPENEIAIATGTVDEIANQNVLSSACPLRFIITVDKLREGWDCPFAYVLCSFRNTESATAAEQILGRILRMPYAKKKTIQTLNEGYVFITSSNFGETLGSLEEGLIRSGFNRQDIANLIRMPEIEGEIELNPDFVRGTKSITITTPDLPKANTIPPSLARQVEIVPETGSMTLRGEFTPRQVATLEQLMPTIEGKEALQKGLQELENTICATELSPSEKGETFKVPLLSIRQGNIWEVFEDSHLLQGDWKLIDYSSDLSESEFSPSQEKAQGARILIKDDQIQIKYLADVEAIGPVENYSGGLIKISWNCQYFQMTKRHLWIEQSPIY